MTTRWPRRRYPYMWYAPEYAAGLPGGPGPSRGIYPYD